MSVVRSKENEKNRSGDKADLHTHTTHSDGAYTPEEVVRRAAAAGLAVISITDHDSLNGVAEAMEHGRKAGVDVVPGIELSGTLNGREIHIIGYFIDLAHREFTEAIRQFRDERFKRAERIVSRLNKMDIPLKIDSVLGHAGEGSVGRPHIARAMVQEGYADSYYQVFTRYIGDTGPAFEPKARVDAVEIISLINRAGGLSVIAHPGKSTSETELLSLIRAGIDGIEVTHPSHTPELSKYYRGIVNQYYLVETGGSDFHGGLKGDDQNLGRIHIPVELVEAMQRRLPAR